MTICLAMIVKNEAHCISKCLESVKSFIDYWIICNDSTSTDNLKQIVDKTMKDIPGELHISKWKDFSTNRNESLELARPHADYILVIDADDFLQVNSANVFDNLSELAYDISFIDSSISYNRIQLFKSNLDAKYKGILHEYLDVSNIKPIQLSGCNIIRGTSGKRSSDPNKYIKDALLFEKAILDEPNNSRYVFYAAQSYRDAARPTRALDLYLKRSSMGGWDEEQYVSLLEAAKIIEAIFPNDTFHIEEMYISAFNKKQTRIESLVYLSKYCRERKLFNKAYFYALCGSGISKPESGLFIEYECYDWKIIDELAIAAYYIGKKDEAKAANIALLSSGLLPKDQIDRVENNLSFCI